MDDLVSDRPGARLAPRAIRGASSPPGPHLEVKVDAFAELRIVDFGDAPVIPADAGVSHAAIETTVGRCSPPACCPWCSAATTRSPSRPCVRSPPLRGPVGMVHFDTHTDTGAEVFGVERSHGTFIRRLIDGGQLDAARYAQIGLRGYWPGEAEFSWQAERGVTSLFAHDVRDLGIREVVARAIAAVGPGPVYLTVDVDVLDPGFIPGTGTPEPGGMTPSELLLAVRTVAAELELVGADVVEVIPMGSARRTPRRLSRSASCARRSPGSRCAGGAERQRRRRLELLEPQQRHHRCAPPRVESRTSTRCSSATSRATTISIASISPVTQSAAMTCGSARTASREAAVRPASSWRASVTST